MGLLLRMHDVDQGAIRIDDQDIREVTQESLRRSIALIPQDTNLFHRGLLENIRYGRPGATDDEVELAARRAHAHEFIVELDHGYDTLVGERGIKLSGGQRQRIAIARAILKMRRFCCWMRPPAHSTATASTSFKPPCAKRWPARQ